jgi:hypothetical protein
VLRRFLISDVGLMAPTDDLRAAAAAKGSPIPAEWGALVPRGGMSRAQVCDCKLNRCEHTYQSCNLFFKILRSENRVLLTCLLTYEANVSTSTTLDE